MSDEIRADYDQLEQVAGQFSTQAEAIQQMLQTVRSSMDKLEDDGWIGRGSDAFFAEMHDEVLPAVLRLYDSLMDANQVTKDIVQTMQDAEDEASSPFRAM